VIAELKSQLTSTVGGIQEVILTKLLNTYIEDLEEKTTDWEDEYTDIEIKTLSRKVMLAHELGIVEYLHNKIQTESEIGRMLGAIMSEKGLHITKLIYSIKNDNHNNPYKSNNNKSWLKDILPIDLK